MPQRGEAITMLVFGCRKLPWKWKWMDLGITCHILRSSSSLLQSKLPTRYPARILVECYMCGYHGLEGRVMIFTKVLASFFRPAFSSNCKLIDLINTHDPGELRWDWGIGVQIGGTCSSSRRSAGYFQRRSRKFILNAKWLDGGQMQGYPHWVKCDGSRDISCACRILIRGHPMGEQTDPAQTVPFVALSVFYCRDKFLVSTRNIQGQLHSTFDIRPLSFSFGL
ncbi:hypothetical protein K491DRAFT_326714 [Lophiostoma macrostomum CBS 122681]|uniref:Uncharacterized protein n=1 Tax=Lophiostoma macrostomum CBS 122681 TaxID=1314788 RepID=A0A6A6TFM7_9PLEO|nr:hypothetical protein K491DRAFT_326714 [Lophiostoma macrostomum CBS 122681]